MVIDPVTSESISVQHPEMLSRADPCNTFSTLTALQECRYKRKASLFSWFEQQLLSFWSWLISWIPRRSQPKEWVYFKIENGEEEVNKYRLLKEGKRTENVISMGQKTIYLNEFSFPDPSALHDLPLMLEQIMEREQIDVIQTKSFAIAIRLWKCGLKTDGTWTLNISSRAPVGRLFSRVINRAMNERHTLNHKGLSALEGIEEKLVMAIVTDAFTQETHLPTFFRQAISDLERAFPASYLLDASTRIMEGSELQITKAMVSDFREEIPYAIPHGLGLPISVDLPIALLFELATAMDISIDRQLAMPLDHLVIFKKEKK